MHVGSVGTTAASKQHRGKKKTDNLAQMGGGLGGGIHPRQLQHIKRYQVCSALRSCTGGLGMCTAQRPASFACQPHYSLQEKQIRFCILALGGKYFQLGVQEVGVNAKLASLTTLLAMWRVPAWRKREAEKKTASNTAVVLHFDGQRSDGNGAAPLQNPSL